MSRHALMEANLMTEDSSLWASEGGTKRFTVVSLYDPHSNSLAPFGLRRDTLLQSLLKA